MMLPRNIFHGPIALCHAMSKCEQQSAASTCNVHASGKEITDLESMDSVYLSHLIQFDNRRLHTSLQNNNKSVSYTHLRAHETVLDLVCRLLLEKKNKNSNT
eukprot:TRINITY_DN23381_c0_g1_i1.p1 TRINITY_DN23381_c0_g1~~TRINITY_DN23381_c0_g1_i1.p1  ORF type:complete len:102 (+),score=19.56 TRINITY_DN23381_c0_g1_i1:189-494(+)